MFVKFWKKRLIHCRFGRIGRLDVESLSGDTSSENIGMKRIILGMVLLLVSGCGNHEKISLPHGYIWQATTPNQSEIISPAGGVILSGQLSLWGKYPFVYGNGDIHGKEFILNLQTGEIIFFDSSQDFDSFLERRKLPLFYTARSDKHQTSVNNIIYLRDSRSETFMKNVKGRMP